MKQCENRKTVFMVQWGMRFRVKRNNFQLDMIICRCVVGSQSQKIAMSLDFDKIEYRAVIKFMTLQGHTATFIKSDLDNVYRENSPSSATVKRWTKEFQRGRLSLEDDYRSGRPREAVIPANVALIEEMVRKDPRVKVRELEEWTGLSHGSILTILHRELGMTKLCSRWIPKALSLEQKKKRLESSETLLAHIRQHPENFWSRLVTGDETWIHLYDPESKVECSEWHYLGSPPPKRVKPQRSSSKVMATVFWDRDGILLLDFLPINLTLNGEYYSSLLKQLRSAIKEKRRGLLSRGPIILEDNARPHVCKIARDTGAEAGFTYVDHPPYSPDLAPSDNYLFSKLKKFLRGRRFGDISEAKDAVVGYLETQPKTFYNSGIVQLESNLVKCIDAKGDYFV